MSTTVESAVVTPTDSAEEKPAKPASPFASRYGTFCYHFFGERFDRDEKSETITQRLQMAGMNITPGMHYSMVFVTTILASVVGGVVGFLLFDLGIHSPIWFAYVLGIAGVAGGATYGGFSFLISSRIANRKDALERELPFTLSELSVLASTGSSPIRLVRRMSVRDHDPAMTAEFKRVVYKTDIQGKDLITALAETAKESASTSVREAFWDLANMIHQGGNLDEYLRAKSDDVLKLRRLVQEEFIERLTTFLDMYVSLVLVGVLMIAVGAFLINALGSTAAGLNANELLLLLTFGLVPVSVAMTIILISIAYARAE